MCWHWTILQFTSQLYISTISVHDNYTTDWALNHFVEVLVKAAIIFILTVDHMISCMWKKLLVMTSHQRIMSSPALRAIVSLFWFSSPQLYCFGSLLLLFWLTLTDVISVIFGHSRQLGFFISSENTLPYLPSTKWHYSGTFKTWIFPSGVGGELKGNWMLVSQSWGGQKHDPKLIIMQ